HELAAVLVEPPRSRRPDVQPKEFLLELRRLTEEAGAALIFDEVVTGFRFHPGGAQAVFGIQADLVAYGKAVGGGVPVAVIAGKAAFMDAIDGGMWRFGDSSFPEADTTYFAGTYFKHPMMMAAVWASLSHIKNRGVKLQEELEQMTSRLVKTLNEYFEQDDVPIRIIYYGSLFRFTYSSGLRRFMPLFYYHLLEKGVYICETRNCFLSTAHTDDDIEYVLRAIKETVAEMREGDLMPGPPQDKPDGSGPGTGGTKGSKQTSGAQTSTSGPESSTAGASREPGLAEGSEQARAVPLTEAQKELWVLSQMGDDASVAYNMSISLDLRGPLDLSAMRKAFQTIVDRHEALRITFSPDGDYQLISPSRAMNVGFIDLSSLNDIERGEEVLNWLASATKTPFDLVTGPLIRASIARLEDRHHILVFTTHHTVTDGYSLGVLLRELRAVYSAECQQIPYNLPEPLRFSDYAAWQADMQQGEAMVEAEKYWLNQFLGQIPVLELPTDRPRPRIQTFNGARQHLKLTSLVSRLERMSGQHRATLFMTLLAAFKVLLSRLSSQDDLIVGVPAAGQTASNSKNLVGYCINLLPLRSNAARELPFKDYLSTVKRALLDAYDYQNYPFNRLVKQLNAPRDASRSPLVSAILNLDHPSRRSKFFDLDDSPFMAETNSVQFDIDLNISQVDDELIFECDYNTDLFDGETIRRWMEHYETLL
ncbi:MAG TPA: aminotransferase class III-fold pyridoxal phosphate-dependent enzyme, partial [Blastocatellia bacterium]